MSAENKPQFAVGDRVQFMKFTQSGSSMSFGTRVGTITGFSKPKGLKACVKAKNGRTTWVPLAKLRRLGAPTHVGDVFNAMVSAHQGGAQ